MTEHSTNVCLRMVEHSNICTLFNGPLSSQGGGKYKWTFESPKYLPQFLVMDTRTRPAAYIFGILQCQEAPLPPSLRGRSYIYIESDLKQLALRNTSYFRYALYTYIFQCFRFFFFVKGEDVSDSEGNKKNLLIYRPLVGVWIQFSLFRPCFTAGRPTSLSWSGDRWDHRR